MALDEALLGYATGSGHWVFRVYGWSEPTVSFGRHQSAARSYDRFKIHRAGFGAVRRPTGGRAILHHREVTYSVAAPIADAGDLRGSYAAINRLLVDGLRSLGVAAEVAASVSRATAPNATPCFDHPSDGELVVSGKKLVGSAQWRSGTALLQHGSILVEDDQSTLTSLFSDDPSAPTRLGRSGAAILPVATLTALLGTAPAFETVADALTGAVRRQDSAAKPLVIDADLRTAAQALEHRYADEAWTWRR